jgi:hypothetical protein
VNAMEDSQVRADHAWARRLRRAFADLSRSLAASSLLARLRVMATRHAEHRHRAARACQQISILPHPRWNTGREASEINRPRENSARARDPIGLAGGPFFLLVRLCVCVSVRRPVCRPKFGFNSLPV